MTSVIAHRGASREHPENTIDAFRAAGKMGADAVELDVRRSADRHVVVVHDAVVADGRVVGDLPRTALPSSVPDLSPALEACDGMWVNVEIKNDPNEPGFDPTDGIVDDVMAVVAAEHALERVLISSFRAETVSRCRELHRAARTAWLCLAADESAVQFCVDHGHEAVHPYVDLLARGDVERCHAAGLRVNTWTCNDPARMRELIGWGVDGIVTDVPDVLVAVLADLPHRT